jgi:hypothetical protein
VAGNRTTSAAITVSVVANPFVNLGVNAGVDVSPYSADAVPGEPSGQSTMHSTEFSGMVYDGNRHRLVHFGGGHNATNYDAVNTFSLDALTWAEDYPPTPLLDMLPGNYDFARGAWLSGSDGGPYPRPAAKHSLDEHVVVGNEYILLSRNVGDYPYLPGDWSGTPSYVNGVSHYTNTLDRVAHYNLVTRTWSWSATAATAINFPAQAFDPVSGRIIELGRDGLQTYDPVTRTRSAHIDFLALPGATRVQDEAGNTVPSAQLSINANMVYFPPNQKLYYFIGSTVFEVTLDRSNWAMSKVVRLDSASGTPPTHEQETGYAYDTVNHLIGGGYYNGVFYVFDPLTRVWTGKTVQGLPAHTLSFHMIDYVPDDNVYVMVTTSRRTVAYRYARAAVPSALDALSDAARDASANTPASSTVLHPAEAP